MVDAAVGTPGGPTSPGALRLTAVAFMSAGVLHFIVPDAYAAIVPPYLPSPLTLVLVSGFFEFVGGAGLLVARLRTPAAIGLLVLLVAVLPANVEMLRQAQARDAAMATQAAYWIRLPLQPLLMWWVWRVSRPRRDLST